MSGTKYREERRDICRIFLTSHAACSGAGVNDSRGGYATGNVGQNTRVLGVSSPARSTGDARREPPARDGGGGVSAQTASRRSLR